MRVIAGEFRRRVLKSLPGLEVRPTPDRLRESLFNVLAQRIAGSTFVDAYAGTGAVGIEALSRGASRVYFIERSKSAVSVIRDNLRMLEAEGRTTLLAGKVSVHLADCPMNIVFLDPPYAEPKEYDVAMQILGRMLPQLAIVQHEVRLKLAPNYGSLAQFRVLKQGDNCLSFFEPATHADNPDGP